MLSLPESPYELAHWGQATVQPNCHIAYQRKFYSASFEYLGEKVDVWATQLTVELFYHHQRIASHKRLWGKDDYATIDDILASRLSQIGAYVLLIDLDPQTSLTLLTGIHEPD